MRFPLAAVAVVAAIVLAPPAAQADLEAVKSEKKLEKRSKLALENADAMLDVAREAYRTGDAGKLHAALVELQESVELAYQSLVDTGKKPRKSASHYKRGEISTRQLLRRLDTFMREMSYMDRDQVESVIKAVQKIHDSFLLDVMGGGK